MRLFSSYPCWKTKINFHDGLFCENEYKSLFRSEQFSTENCPWMLKRCSNALTSKIVQLNPWWRHQIETFSALLAICTRNSPVTGEFPTQRPMTRSFDVFFDLHPNKRLNKVIVRLVIWDAIDRVHYDVTVRPLITLGHGRVYISYENSSLITYPCHNLGQSLTGVRA